jgi:hypothetical protein
MNKTPRIVEPLSLVILLGGPLAGDPAYNSSMMAREVRIDNFIQVEYEVLELRGFDKA